MNPVLFIPAPAARQSKRKLFYSYEDIVLLLDGGNTVESFERVVENGKTYHELIIAGNPYRVSKATAEKLAAEKA